MTPLQFERLHKMMQTALVEIRYLAWEGKSRQAGDLADAFHNLPTDIMQSDYNLRHFREAYLKKLCRLIMSLKSIRLLRWTMSDLNKIETVFELHDDASVKEKINVMHKYEAAFDDERNFTDGFLDKLEGMMEFGSKYKLIVERVA